MYILLNLYNTTTVTTVHICSKFITGYAIQISLHDNVQYKLWDAPLNVNLMNFQINMNLGQAGFELITELSLIRESYEAAALPSNYSLYK